MGVIHLPMESVQLYVYRTDLVYMQMLRLCKLFWHKTLHG